MHVVQTEAMPPNHGKRYFPMMGWIWNSRKALTNVVIA